MKTAYLCDITHNAACKKDWCVRYGGPCLATLDPKYAKRDKDGNPIAADEEEINAAAERYFMKGCVPK